MKQVSSGDLLGHWALILGASSGFGAATARELSRFGMNIAGVHLDRKSNMPAVKQLIKDIEAEGVQTAFFNINAADSGKRRDVLEQLKPKLGSSRILVLLHSLAFGTLKSCVSDDPKQQLTKGQIEMTLDVMANSLIYWVQDLFERKMIGHGSRIFAMTSSGGRCVWPMYGAVSAAKAALQSYIRQLGMELAPHGITANAVRAGVTDTPALRQIPGNKEMMELAKRRNPHHRLTTPADVARAITALSSSKLSWVTGNVIGVDGGEDIVG